MPLFVRYSITGGIDGGDWPGKKVKGGGWPAERIAAGVVTGGRMSDTPPTPATHR